MTSKHELAPVRFKVGDEVRCIDMTPLDTGRAPPVSGQIASINGEFLELYTHGNWLAHRFELVSGSPDASERKAECAACGDAGARVPIEAGYVLCKTCNDVRPWSQVLANIYARRNPHTGPTAAEVREAYGKRVPCENGTHFYRPATGSQTDVCGKCNFARSDAEAYYRNRFLGHGKPEPKRADPYEAWRLRGDDGYHRELMDKLDTNSGRRDRLVAALAGELARPVEPRFPPEGRSCRVYKVNR